MRDNNARALDKNLWQMWWKDEEAKIQEIFDN